MITVNVIKDVIYEYWFCFTFFICTTEHLWTHFFQGLSFYTRLKHQKIYKFLIFSGGIKREHWGRWDVLKYFCCLNLVLLRVFLYSNFHVSLRVIISKSKCNEKPMKLLAFNETWSISLSRTRIWLSKKVFILTKPF